MEQGTPHLAVVEPEKTDGPKPAVRIVIEVFEDGKRKIDAKDSENRPVAVGHVRDIIKECLERYEQRCVAAMVQTEVSRVVKEAAQATKDRNLLARLINALHG